MISLAYVLESKNEIFLSFEKIINFVWTAASTCEREYGFLINLKIKNVTHMDLFIDP